MEAIRCLAAAVATLLLLATATAIPAVPCAVRGNCTSTQVAVLRGTDVVDLAANGLVSRGQGEYTVRYQGYDWWFKNKHNMGVFQANPSQFAPRLGGFCALAVGQACITNTVCEASSATRSAAVELNNQAVYVHQGRLYLFNHDALPAMLGNQTSGASVSSPEQLLATAERNWAAWYPSTSPYNTDAVWPYAECLTCNASSGADTLASTQRAPRVSGENQNDGENVQNNPPPSPPPTPPTSLGDLHWAKWKIGLVVLATFLLACGIAAFCKWRMMRNRQQVELTQRLAVNHGQTKGEM